MLHTHRVHTGRTSPPLNHGISKIKASTYFSSWYINSRSRCTIAREGLRAFLTGFPFEGSSQISARLSRGICKTKRCMAGYTQQNKRHVLAGGGGNKGTQYRSCVRVRQYCNCRVRLDHKLQEDMSRETHIPNLPRAKRPAGLYAILRVAVQRVGSEQEKRGTLNYRPITTLNQSRLPKLFQKAVTDSLSPPYWQSSGFPSCALATRGRAVVSPPCRASSPSSLRTSAEPDYTGRRSTPCSRVRPARSEIVFFYDRDNLRLKNTRFFSHSTFPFEAVCCPLSRLCRHYYNNTTVAPRVRVWVGLLEQLRLFCRGVCVNCVSASVRGSAYASDHIRQHSTKRKVEGARRGKVQYE